MSSSDLFTADYPHGTPEGYDDGCRGGSCPGADEWGLSCKHAKQLSRSDYQYQKLVKQGLTPAEIADKLGLMPEVGETRGKSASVTKRAPKPKPADHAAAKKAAKAELAATFSVDDAYAEVGRAYAEAVDAAVATAGALDDSATPLFIPKAYMDMADPNGAMRSQVEAEIAAEKEPPSPAAEHAAPTPKEIRTWAIERGYEVKPMGKLPQHIIDHYWETHDVGATLATTADAADADEATWTPDPVTIVTEPAGDRPDWAHVTLTEDLARAQTDRDALAEELEEAQGELTRARGLAARLEEELHRSEATREHISEKHAASLIAADIEKRMVLNELGADASDDPVIAAHNLRTNYLALAEARDRDTADNGTIAKLASALEFTIRQWAMERDRNQALTTDLEAFRQDWETVFTRPIALAEVTSTPFPPEPDDATVIARVRGWMTGR